MGFGPSNTHALRAGFEVTSRALGLFPLPCAGRKMLMLLQEGSVLPGAAPAWLSCVPPLSPGGCAVFWR